MAVLHSDERRRSSKVQTVVNEFPLQKSEIYGQPQEKRLELRSGIPETNTLDNLEINPGVILNNATTVRAV